MGEDVLEKRIFIVEISGLDEEDDHVCDLKKLIKGESQPGSPSRSQSRTSNSMVNIA